MVNRDIFLQMFELQAGLLEKCHQSSSSRSLKNVDSAAKSLNQITNVRSR